MPYLILIFSLIQPIYALLFSIPEVVKKKSGSISVFCIALAFATLTYTMIPPADFDLARHYDRIYSLKGYSFHDVITMSGPGYRLFDIYAWLINLLSLPKEFFPASIVFIAYYLVLTVFKEIKLRFLQGSSTFTITLVFITFWLSIGYVGLVSGIRNPFANILVFYLSYKLIFNNKIALFLIGSLFAFFIHPFSITPAIMVLLAYRFSWWAKSSKYLIIIGLILAFATKTVTFIIEYISNLLQNFSFYSATYFDESGEFGGGLLEILNIYGVIMHVVIPRIPIYLAQIYLLLLQPKRSDSLYLLLALLSLYLGIFVSYTTLFGRMGAFFLFIFSMFIALRNIPPKDSLSRVVLAAYALSLLVYSIVGIYRYSGFILSSLPDALYKPLLFIYFNI